MAKIRDKKICVMFDCNVEFLPNRRTDKTCSKVCSRKYQLELGKVSKFKRGVLPKFNNQGKLYYLDNGFIKTKIN